MAPFDFDKIKQLAQDVHKVRAAGWRLRGLLCAAAAGQMRGGMRGTAWRCAPHCVRGAAACGWWLRAAGKRSVRAGLCVGEQRARRGTFRAAARSAARTADARRCPMALQNLKISAYPDVYLKLRKVRLRGASLSARARHAGARGARA
jgi:hypothetical protein